MSNPALFSGRNLRFFILLCFGAIAFVFSRSVLGIIAADLIAKLSFSRFQIGVLSAGAVSGIMMGSYFCKNVFKNNSEIRSLVAGAAVCLISYLIMAHTVAFAALLPLFFLVGAGSAMAFVSGVSTFSKNVPGSLRGTAMGSAIASTIVLLGILYFTFPLILTGGGGYSTVWNCMAGFMAAGILFIVFGQSRNLFQSLQATGEAAKAAAQAVPFNKGKANAIIVSYGISGIVSSAYFVLGANYTKELWNGDLKSTSYLWVGVAAIGIVSSVTTGRISNKFDPFKLLLIFSALSVAGLFAMYTGAAFLFGTLAYGYLHTAIFATTPLACLRTFGDVKGNEVFAKANAMNGLGWVVGPAALTLLSDVLGGQAMMWMISALLFTVCTGIFFIMSGQSMPAINNKKTENAA